MSKDYPLVIEVRRHEVRHHVDARTAWQLAEGAARWYGHLYAKPTSGGILVRAEPRWWWKVLGLGRWAKRRGIEIAIRVFRRHRPGTLLIDSHGNQND